MPWGRARFIGFVAFVALLATCKPDPAAIDRGRTFFCDASSNKPGCGTTPDGTPYTCFGGKQLGAGRDFCAEPCPADIAASPGADSICLKQAKLSTCRPSERTAEDPDGCGKDLACLRTDLTRDEGVCLAMQVCSDDTQCKGVVSTCGSTVLKAMFPRAPYDATNLPCVVSGCKARGTGCPVGETCLPSVVQVTTPVPDICVPTCDSGENCPPNYTCWRRTSGLASENVCIPTLPGARCTTALDCWAGDCVDTGEGFSLCAVPCQRDQDCVPFSDSSRRQYCGLRDGKRYCMGFSPLAGSLCGSDEHCRAGQRCYFTSPYWPDRTPLGECRLPCGEGDRCPVRGGLAHACFVRGSDRSCYPGVLGVTCQQSEDCLAGRTCESLAPEDGPPVADADAGAEASARTAAVRVCTQPCTSDPDCLDGWGNQEGYCTGGWCRLGRQLGSPCTRDQQCAANRCEGATPEAAGTCVKR